MSLRTVCLPFVLTAAVAAQQCPSCSGHGQFDCKLHSKAMLDKERAVKFCSDAALCKACAGALVVDCKSCRNEAAEKAIADRQQVVKEWLSKQQQAVDVLTKNNDTHHLFTDNVDLTFSIKPLTVGKDKIETHPLMHLYGERIEALRQSFLDLFEVDKKQFSARLQIYMFRDQQDQSLIGPRVTELGATRSIGLKSLGSNAVYSMWMDPHSITDDEALHRNIVHNVTHLLLANMTPAMWIGNRKHGWVDEGLAHWFEDKVTGKCTNFCFEEVLLQPGAGFKGGRWRTPVRKLVDAGKLKPFAELSQLNNDQLTFEDHAIAFAYVDFLIQSFGGAKFRDMLRMLKSEKPTREALQQSFGLGMLAIDGQFQEWVKAHYSPVEKDK